MSIYHDGKSLGHTLKSGCVLGFCDPAGWWDRVEALRRLGLESKGDGDGRTDGRTVGRWGAKGKAVQVDPGLTAPAFNAFYKTRAQNIYYWDIASSFCVCINIMNRFKLGYSSLKASTRRVRPRRNRWAALVDDCHGGGRVDFTDVVRDWSGVQRGSHFGDTAQCGAGCGADCDEIVAVGP